MPKRPNKMARILVPLALFAIGLTVPIAIIATTRQTQQPDETSPPADVAAADPQSVDPAVERPTEEDDAGAGDASEPDAPPPEQPQPDTQQEQPEQAAPPAGAFAAETFEGQALATGFAPLGGLSNDSPFELRVEFSHVGAGVSSIRLTRELDSVRSDREWKDGEVDPEKHIEVQGEIVSQRYLVNAAGQLVDEAGNVLAPGAAPVVGNTMLLVPLAAADLEIDGQTVGLAVGPGDTPIWRQVGDDTPGLFEAFVRDDAGNRVVRIERRYVLEPGSHDLRLEQRVENLTDRSLQLRWRQFGPVDMEEDELGYGGSKRRVRFGYLLDPGRDSTRQFVQATDFLWRRDKIAGSGSLKNFPDGVIWPNSHSAKEQYELVWVGLSNRYFASVLHPLIDPDAAAPDKVFRHAQSVKRVFGNQGEIILAVEGARVAVAAGGSLDLGMAMYAGPMSRKVMGEEPLPAATGVPGIVVYNFGGPCAFCTFPWLTGPLLGLLRWLQSITLDYGFAIILLVVIVRTLLHPITRWSQIRMQKFTKQMQNMAPKQKIIQEKFKDDRQRMQQEMAKLWREEGVSPAGFLGCLPMFLQSPIWIALYATLYFAIDLRHQPAFFGVFQDLTGNAWPFLADLSVGDRAIFFGGGGITIPLMGKIDSINLLPLLLGVVFYLHQKYLTPPPSATMTPEQETQQKMMKIMMVVLFPLIMYNAPSGLALYFISNSALGIIESRWIRKHVEKHGLLETENLKKKPKKGGFMSRLKAMAEEQQRLKQQGASQRQAPRQQQKGAQLPQRKYKKR